MNAANNKNRLRLPLSIQDFVKLREDGCVYVDKTVRIHELITGSGCAFFLSRPRRFGKSLLCSTLKAVFEGRRELFGEIAGRPALAIDSLEWNWEPHPVIHIDLNPGDYERDGVSNLYDNVNRDLEFYAKKYGVPLIGNTIGDKLARLIQALHERCGKRVVVIIDEYDKPMLSTIDNIDLCKEMRGVLKGFYGILKSSDPHLQFLFITGVTKFSHVSVFSDLNHLSDLTLNPRYADICGWTEEELLQNFEPEIAAILEETGREREDYLNKLRRYYDGYRFTEKPLKIYNPYGLLHHFDNNGKFEPYWYESGTPSFLVKLITKQKINIADLSDMQVKHEEFRKYDVEDMEAMPVLYQSGYLTITDYDDNRNRYRLDFPNEEVRSSFSESLLRQYLKVPADRARALINRLPDALEDGEIENAIEAIKQYMAGVPYDIITQIEYYYQTVVFMIFRMFGLTAEAEARTSAGRMDARVETKNFIYFFEFKLDKTADEALVQIDKNEYTQPYRGRGKKMFKVGVNFDSKTRNIGDWKYAEE